VKIKANGIEINYVVEGAGPWVTMAHSLAGNLSLWDEQAKVLKNSFRVLRFDIRGHGDTSAPPGPYSFDDLADDLHALLTALDITSTHFVGISLGAMLGEVYALNYPGVFESMVLADTTARRPDDAEQLWGNRITVAEQHGMKGLVDNLLSRWLTAPYRYEHKQTATRVGKVIRDTPVGGFVGCGHAIATLDVLHRLHEIQCPVLIMVGDHDHGTTPAQARQIRDNLPGSKLTVIPSASHLSNIEQPEVFNTEMLAFLTAHVVHA
jgi:3-oxoadipate enol-lactonase